MRRNNVILFSSVIFSVGMFLWSCTTEDVYPVVKLESGTEILDGDGGIVIVKAVLNGPVKKSLRLPLNFGGTAVLNTQYSISGSEIVIPEKSSEGSISIRGIISGDTVTRTIEISLSNVDRVVNTVPSKITLRITNCSVDSDNDGVNDCIDECIDVAGPVENNGCPWLGLLINEVLYDPPSDIAGDANGDGTRDPLQDEFVELYNSNPNLDISGYSLSDASMVRHTFPAGTILPSKGVMVVFGGGNPNGPFGNAQVQTATEGQLNLNNAGDILTLRNTTGDTIAVFDINGLSGNPDESYTRNPDIKGSFIRHSTVPSASGALFSPGRKVDGSNF